MARGILDLHNLMRWIVLLTGFYAVIRGASGLGGKKAFLSGDRKAGLFFMISMDVQLLIGLALYVVNKWFAVLSSGSGFMSNPAQRFFAVEHELSMLIALVLVHVMYSRVKRLTLEDPRKFKTMFWLSLIALIVIIAAVPWPFREYVGRPWFPGM